MTPDPKLVEALARSWFIGWRGPGHTWDNAPQDHRDLLMDRARDFFENHRLVQLPEEPDGWTDSGWARALGKPDLPSIRVFKDIQPWIDNVPAYIIPGGPQEVEP